MTISYSSISSGTQSGSTSVLFRQPAALAADDYIVWVCVSKYPTAGPATPAGLTSLASLDATSGGAAGADTGNVSLDIFGRVSDGTEDGLTGTVSISGGNTAISRSVSYARTAGTGWDVAVAHFEQTPASNDWSGTTGSLDLAAGDMVLLILAKNSDADGTHGTPTISASGITFGTFTARQTPVGTTQGDDCGLSIGEVPVTAGSGTGGVTVSLSLSGSAGTTAGILALVRLREQGAGSTPISFSGTVPTLTGTQGSAFSQSLASYFSGSLTPFTYSLQSGTLPAGLSLSSGGTISGTPTVGGTFAGLVVRGTDTGSNTADTNAFQISLASSPSADVGYYGTALTSTAAQQHTTASHSFHHDGSWWTFMRSGADWNLYEESGNVPGSAGSTVDWVATPHISAVHTTALLTVAVDSANNKAYVLGFSGAAATTVFRVLTYSAGAWTVTQSFNLTNSAGVGLGTSSTFASHGKLSLGVDPNGVPYVVAGNKGEGASATNGVHIAWPDNPSSLGGTWTSHTIDSGPATEADSSGRFAGVISQSGTSHLVVVYTDDSTGSTKMATHPVETTLTNYTSGWVITTLDNTLSVDNHLWAGVMDYGGDQVVVTITKCGDGAGAGRLYAYTAQLGTSLSWTVKRHRVTNGTGEAGLLAESPSRPSGVLDQINGDVYVLYHAVDSYAYGWVGYKKASLSALLAAANDTAVFDIAVGRNTTPIINDESYDSASDVKTPAHPITAGMGYAPVTALITSASTTGDSIWWNRLVLASDTTFTASVADATASGVQALVNRSISAQPANCDASGFAASLNRGVHCSPAECLGSGLSASLNTSIAAQPADGACDGASAIINTDGSTTISAAPADAVADGLEAQLHRIFGAQVGAAIATGVTATVSMGSGSGASPAEVWGYELSNGMTAEQTLVAIHEYLRDLHRIHGLEAGSPLIVSATARAAGGINQLLSTVAGVTTVTRS